VSDGEVKSRDVVWNVASLAVAGGAAILLNFLVGLLYGSAVLGIFNQVFAAFSLASQLAALGLHYSALRATAAAAGEAELRAIVVGALVATAGVAAIAAVAFAAAGGAVAALVHSPGVARGMLLAAPGLFCFALSKVALGSLNGLRRMRTYAVLYAGRFLLMIGCLPVFVAAGVSGEDLPLLVSLSEAIILISALIALRCQLGRVPGGELTRQVGEHIRFGARGFMSGLFELFARVDILVVGAFASDRVVGAFSFAATLFEGLYQVLFVLRINYAPVVVRLWTEDRKGELEAVIRRARNRTYAGAAAAGLLAVAAYALLLPLVTADAEFVQSWQPFAVLVAGAALAAGYNPFLPLLLYSGRPGRNTAFMLVVFSVNAAGNLALVPLFGPLGSAAATATALAASALLLRAVVARHLGLRI
jgi:O-antigen/teichoic acid export membrane protein